MLHQRFACASLSNPHMTKSDVSPFPVTFTTEAFVRSSSRLFEASSYQAAPKGLPSSFAQQDAFASSRHTVTQNRPVGVTSEPINDKLRSRTSILTWGIPSVDVG